MIRFCFGFWSYKLLAPADDDKERDERKCKIMNERKAWQESGARRRLPKADVLKYLFVISILGLEVGERVRNIFPSALMMGENRNDYTWVLDNEAFLVISKGSRSPLESPTRFSGPSEVRLG